MAENTHNFTKGRLTGKRSAELMNLFVDSICDENPSQRKCGIIDEVQSVQEEAVNSQAIDILAETTADGCIDPISELKDERHSTVSDIESGKESDENDSFDEKLDKFENFRGLGDETKKPGKRVKRCASSILNPVNNCKEKIPILSNGYSNPTGTPKIATENTCAFDSVSQIYAASYIDVQRINRYTPTHSFCDLLYTLFNDNGKRNAVYIKRNKLLHEYFRDETFMKKIAKNLVYINCECTFDYVFRKICDSNPFLSSLKQIRRCSDCGEIEEGKYLPYVPISVQTEVNSKLQSWVICSHLWFPGRNSDARIALSSSQYIGTSVASSYLISIIQ